MSHALFQGFIDNDIAAIECEPFELKVGIICSSIHQIALLLADLKRLSSEHFIQQLKVYLLPNGCVREDLRQFINDDIGAMEAISFCIIENKSTSLLPIGAARTRLQQHIGRDMADSASGCLDHR